MIISYEKEKLNMKKKIIPLVALLACASLITACDKEENSGEPQGSEALTSSQVNNYGDASNDASISSDGSSVNGGQTNAEGLDALIAEFLDGINVTVPSLNSYNLEYDVLFYYAYDQYYIAASCLDTGNEIADEYVQAFTANTNLVTYNDDDDDDPMYPVSQYGYLFGDASQEVLVNFMNDSGYFVIYIYRNDGLYGSVDVSNVDTNWYVDYINLNGCDLLEEFPSALIKSSLGITTDLVIPSITVDECAALFVEETSINEPDTFYVILEGDKMLDYAAILDGAGYTSDIEEHTGESFDWDTFDYIEYKYYTAYGYDTNKTIYINMQLDELGNTLIVFNKFNDLFTLNPTSNTDWSNEDKALMNETLHQVLPFLAFGDDYVLYDGSDEDWDLLVLEDTYFEDLSAQYIDILLDNGYVKDDTTYEDTYYCLDNGYVYIEIYVGYEGGNYLEIYFSESQLEPLTSLSLNQSSLDIVSGASYQLEAIYNPTSAKHPTTWSSSNDEIATVDDKGLVTINSNASANSTVTITATTLSGKTASCTFTVKTNEVTGIAFKEDNYSVIPGAEAFAPEYYFLPYGATNSGNVTYSINPDNAGISYDTNGKLSATESAVVGATATITVTCGSYSDTATVKVAPATVSHTLTGTFFGIKEGETNYNTYTKTVDGASYEAQAAAGNNADKGKGLQLRSKNNNSGVIANNSDRSCKSITFVFDSNTQAGRKIDIYASNSPFAITDMYNSSVTKVGTIDYDKNNLTQTYTFTDNYSYIGFRSSDGAVYLKSVDIVW